MPDIPETQCAVQLVGPNRLTFNKSRQVPKPGKHQILCRVEAVGLCFSDLKLLKQFSSHVRKSEVLSGIDPDVLEEIPSYVPGPKPTVPGHEVVVRIQAAGPDVNDFKIGQRYLVQTDYRWLKTASSNGAFGYNFEGALQQYVLMDKRVITSPQGESMLLPVSEKLSASAIALVEPWACVEDAYASGERQTLKASGRMLVVADVQIDENALVNLLARYGRPAQITWVSKTTAPTQLNLTIKSADSISKLTNTAYDDVIYFGSNSTTLEALFSKIAVNGLLNVVLCGCKFNEAVSVAVGRVHYGGIRIIGTTTCDPAEPMEYIPATDEIRPCDKINVIGAGGPMGMMHVIRNICHGVENVSVFAGDVDDDRLAALTKIAAPLAKKNNVRYETYNPAKNTITETFDYIALMAPIPRLVADSLTNAAEGCLINIFAGIPATVKAEIDLDGYIEKRLYFIGTSGSTLEDMKRVLAKVQSAQLDTNFSVAAICGLESAVEGIRAVENRSIAGKIIVYPSCRGLGLVELKNIDSEIPELAPYLTDGLWTKEAEQALLEIYQNS